MTHAVGKGPDAGQNKVINAIANMAFVDWSDNAEISDSAPDDYWPVMTEGMEATQIKKQVRLHALPIGWHSSLPITAMVPSVQSFNSQFANDTCSATMGASGVESSADSQAKRPHEHMIETKIAIEFFLPDSITTTLHNDVPFES